MLQQGRSQVVGEGSGHGGDGVSRQTPADTAPGFAMAVGAGTRPPGQRRALRFRWRRAVVRDRARARHSRDLLVLTRAACAVPVDPAPFGDLHPSGEDAVGLAVGDPGVTGHLTEQPLFAGLCG
ncbi:hypothetical protein ADL05_24825 [Nocardiopsis sp. NRRL B-16309]|nr:hypothetical protein ADL05_24825 [Nocardiopsis sp. NRRL B-16309]